MVKSGSTGLVQYLNRWARNSKRYRPILSSASWTREPFRTWKNREEALGDSMPNNVSFFTEDYVLISSEKDRIRRFRSNTTHIKVKSRIRKGRDFGILSRQRASFMFMCTWSLTIGEISDKAISPSMRINMLIRSTKSLRCGKKNSLEWNRRRKFMTRRRRER